MKQMFAGWDAVARNLEARAKEDTTWFNAGQRASLGRLAERIPHNGMILADEVGMGKTRIATALARAVTESGGRVAILVPPGVGFQWTKELRDGGIAAPPQILRSLWSYLAAWDPEEETRRPWFEQPILLLSHAFANWHFRKKAKPNLAWRWSLLPAIYAEWRKQRTGRYPHQFRRNEYLDRVLEAARDICANAPQDERSEVFRRLTEIEDQTPWRQAVDAGEYGGNSELRLLLESAVGLGFGSFDLVIIDEAHKSRGADARLSRLLEGVILKSEDARRLAMTATPIELDVSQWEQTLQRLGLAEAPLAPIRQCIKDYADTVQRIRHSWRSSQEARASYGQAAQAFEQSLAPYLLRRDKREDETVQSFAQHAAQDSDAYRLEKEIVIRLEDLTPAWRQTVCAAESLSLVTHQADDPVAKRLRLTLGNGHAIASLIDHLQKDAVADAKQEEAQRQTETDAEVALQENKRSMDKRRSRAEWWHDLMAKASASGGHELYNYPTILKAVETVEAYTRAQEKVLIFGRFTRPLKAITELLNAREMLRCLQDGRPWPQSVVHVMAERDEDERPAVTAAYRQLNCTFGLDQIDSMLAQQYVALEARRKKLGEHLLPWISEGLAEQHRVARALLEAARATIQDASKASLTRAIDDLLDDQENPTPEQCAKAFIDLMAALQDNDVSGDDGGDDPDQQAVALWPQIAQRLHEEYGSQRGTFARLMYGETKPETRRALQLAFNRARSFPRVLVAQSMVGREGLNLHQACRIVLLLHPEWNPGVVEQQIGRVDRVGSHWAKQLGQAIEAGVAADSLPRIEICPVIFQGTYDEYHWKVLNERWDDLRAQLHGVIVPRRLRTDLTPEESEIVRELDKNAPNFSPSK